DPQIEPGANDVLAGIDVDGTWNEVPVDDERAQPAARRVAAEAVEIGVQEFHFHRPRARDDHLHAGPGGPAELVDALAAQRPGATAACRQCLPPAGPPRRPRSRREGSSRTNNRTAAERSQARDC